MQANAGDMLPQSEEPEFMSAHDLTAFCSSPEEACHFVFEIMTPHTMAVALRIEFSYCKYSDIRHFAQNISR